MLKIISLFLLLFMSVYAAISDLHDGIVRNQTLLAFMVPAVVIAVLRGFLQLDYTAVYLENAAAVVLIALVLFYTHVWAGGDCKFVIAAALLYPPEAYIQINRTAITLWAVIVFAFLSGYIYLLGDSVISGIRQKRVIGMCSLARGVRNFLFSYASMIVYIAAFNLLYSETIGRYWETNPVVMCALYYGIAMAANNMKLLRRWPITLALLLADIIASILLRRIPVGTNPFSYLIVFIAVLIRLAATEYNYTSIQTADVRAGMILSLHTTMLFAGSRVKGLPGLSTENLKSRLTPEEANSVRRWGTTTKGLPEITIVRKIPFVLFISIGIVSYLLIWSVIV